MSGPTCGEHIANVLAVEWIGAATSAIVTQMGESRYVRNQLKTHRG